MPDTVPVLHLPDFSEIPVVGCVPSAWACQLALEEKSVPREDRWQPMSDPVPVPSLQHGEQRVSGALPTLLYIDLTWRTPVLLPPRFRGATLTRLQEADALHRTASALFQRLSEVGSAGTPEEMAHPVTLLWRELQRWDRLLQTDSHLAGPWASLADLRVYPYIATVKRLGLSLKETLPHLEEWTVRMRSRSSVIRSWPEPWAEEDGPRPLSGM